MRIELIVCPAHIEEKLQVKHSVTASEAEQALLNKPRIRFIKKVHTQGNDVYAALSRTFAGRYLTVVFYLQTRFENCNHHQCPQYE